MFDFFKNKVGRPSKQTIKKRRIFYLVCTLLIVFIISVCTYMLTSNTDEQSVLESFDMDKLSGNISNIGTGTLDITYIDNVKENKAPENTTISIKEKMSYTGTDKIYYKLDLYQNNRSVYKGQCREVKNDKLATISFKLTKSKLNVLTGIYSDSSCKSMLTRYRTKKYYISSNEEETTEVELPSIELPKYDSNWYVGDSSESFSLNVTPSTSMVSLSSSDSAIMEVVQYGVNNFRLTAKKAGKVIITATSSDGISASVTYTVKEKNYIKLPELPENWTVGNYVNAVIETSSIDSVASVTSSNSDVISVEKVSENVYKLTAKSVGAVTITATSVNGATSKYAYMVTAKPKISIPNYSSVLYAGETTDKFSISVTPSDSTVTLTSSNTSVLQVMKYGDNTSGGNSWALKALKAGTATVTAKSSDGTSTIYKYTVIEAANNIEMPKYPDEWNVGDEYGKFSITVNPTNSTVEVTSSDTSVIAVTKNGTNSWTLKALKAGTATITAKSSNGLKTSYTYKVKQKSEISIPKFSNELVIGKTYGKFSITVTPSSSSVTLSSSNPSVLQVMKYGDNTSSGNSWGLKAKKAGTATITAKSSDGATVSYTYTVKETTTLTMPKYSDELIVGETYGKFSITVTPSSSSVTLSSSNPSVLQVIKYGDNTSSGNKWGLKALKAGTATITAKASDGTTTSYNYTVKQVSSVELPKLSTEWKVGDSSAVFSATVIPSNATVSLVSSNTSVMEVVNKGNNKWQLKAKAKGTATITVTSSSGAKNTYTYTVKEAPTVSMTKYSDELLVGQTYGKFTLTTNTPNSTVSLTSSNPNVLQVIKYGNNSLSGNSWELKALKAGSVQVTATSSEGAKLVYTYKVVDASLSTNGNSLPKTWEYGNLEILVVQKLYPSASTVTVSSSNTNVISVSTIKENVSWQLNAVGIGSTTITVSSSNGKKVTYTYTVTEPKDTKLISMPKFSDTLEVGTTTNKFSISVSPSTALVYLESSNPDVLQVIKHGDNTSSGNSWALKAKKVGTATIKTKSSIGAEMSYTYTVKEVEKSISMTHYTYEYWTSGTSGNINVTVSPSSSTVTVESSNPSVMSVKKVNNTNWTITAISSGSATITASATNGKKISYTYTVKHEYPKPTEMINSNYETKSAGSVTVYFEKTCSSKSKTNIINFINKLPDYAKLSGRAVYVMTGSTWKANGHSSGSAGITWPYSVPYIAIPCDSDYSDSSDNYAIYHEYGHAIDAHYGAISGDGKISNSKKYVELLNSAYKYVSSRGCSKQSNKCSILRGYAYTSSGEFFAESYMMTIRPIVGYSNSVNGITSNWGPINEVTFSPYGTIESEIKKDIETIKKVIK